MLTYLHYAKMCLLRYIGSYTSALFSTLVQRERKILKLHRIAIWILFVKQRLVETLL